MARASPRAFSSFLVGLPCRGCSCSSRQGGDGLPRPCQPSRQGWLDGAQSSFLGGRVSPWHCLSPRQGTPAGVSSSFPTSECLPGLAICTWWFLSLAFALSPSDAPPRCGGAAGVRAQVWGTGDPSLQCTDMSPRVWATYACQALLGQAQSGAQIREHRAYRNRAVTGFLSPHHTLNARSGRVSGMHAVDEAAVCAWSR